MAEVKKGLPPEQEARWKQAWDEATELDRRRFHRLHAMDKLRVLYLIPAGEARTLREATARADGSFEKFMQKRHEGEQG